MPRLAKQADRLDLVGIQDHPYRRRHVDTLALMGAVLAATGRVRVVPDVARVPPAAARRPREDPRHA